MILLSMQSKTGFELIKRAAPIALCLLIVLYFGTHALFGSSGYLALDDIRRAKTSLEAEQSELEARRAALGRDIALLDPRGTDPDFADELVRRHLGVIRPDELIVPLPDAAPAVGAPPQAR